MKNAAKILSFVLILVAIFGLVAAGITAKDVLDSKDFYEKAGEENTKNRETLDNGLKQLQENEAAYLAGREQIEAGEAALAQGKALVEGVQKLQKGYADWQQGYNGLKALAEGAGLPAPAADNVEIFDAAIDTAGVEALKGVPQAIADGKAELAQGVAAAVNGILADETMAAQVAQAGGVSAEQIRQAVEALPEMPYDQFDGTMDTMMQLASGLIPGVEAQIKENEPKLEAGKAQLAAFEGGRDQIIDGLNAVIANPADPGLKSIKDRLGEGFTFFKENGKDLDLEKARAVWNAWGDYSDDSGKVISKELYTRAGAAAAILIASLLALLAGIFGLRGKNNKVLTILAILLGIGGIVALLIAGSYFSEKAGVASCDVILLPVAACAVAVASFAHWFVRNTKKV